MFLEHYKSPPNLLDPDINISAFYWPIGLSLRIHLLPVNYNAVLHVVCMNVKINSHLWLIT